MPTIREIAKAANVSKSTAALALRGDPRCAAKTAHRVEETARRLGYRPNPLVSANMANLRRVVGRRKIQANLAFFYSRETGPPSEVYSFGPAQERAGELGFALEAFPYDDPDVSPKQLHRILRYRNIRGILISHSATPIPHIEFDWSDFAIATIGYTLQNPRVDRVGYDHVENMRLLFDDLRRRQYRRVGLALRRDLDDRISHLLSASYLRYQYEDNLLGKLPLYLGDQTWCRDTFYAWLAEHRPDCVVTVGADTRRWLDEAGVRIPEDLGIVSIWGHGPDEIPSTNNYYLISVAKLARIAIDAIADQLNANQRGVPAERRSILVSSEYVDQNSLRPAPRR